jgi:hypothetical protein
MKAGERPPDAGTTDLLGKPHRLHDFRRKAHVVLLWDPRATAEQRARWKDRRVAEAQRWTWLQAEALVPTTELPGSEPGIYLISRWGHVLAVHPPGDWDMERIERDLLTFEAQDCCDLTKAP